MFTKLTVSQYSLSRSADLTHLAIINLGKLVNFTENLFFNHYLFFYVKYFFIIWKLTSSSSSQGVILSYSSCICYDEMNINIFHEQICLNCRTQQNWNLYLIENWLIIRKTHIVYGFKVRKLKKLCFCISYLGS